MERRLATAAGAAIVIAGTLLHFVYGWSGQNALVGLVSPVNESVWEHTKLLVFPVVAVGTVEAVLLHDVRRVAWATLVEAILGALAIVAVFYTYTGALGTGPILWLDITSFVLVVAGGQWLHLRVLLPGQSSGPPAVVSLLGLLALLVLYGIWTVTPPDLPGSGACKHERGVAGCGGRGGAGERGLEDGCGSCTTDQSAPRKSSSSGRSRWLHRSGGDVCSIESSSGANRAPRPGLYPDGARGGGGEIPVDRASPLADDDVGPRRGPRRGSHA